MQTNMQAGVPLWTKTTKATQTYLLIDCAQLEEQFYHKVTHKKGIQASSLFAHTIHSEAVRAAPLLVALSSVKEEAFIEQVHSIQVSKPAVVWCRSEQPFTEVMENLKDLLFATLPDEKEVLCRYYDPRNLSAFLDIFAQNPISKQSASVVDEWAIWDHDMQKIQYLQLKK